MTPEREHSTNETLAQLERALSTLEPDERYEVLQVAARYPNQPITNYASFAEAAEQSFQQRRQTATEVAELISSGEYVYTGSLTRDLADYLSDPISFEQTIRNNLQRRLQPQEDQQVAAQAVLSTPGSGRLTEPTGDAGHPATAAARFDRVRAPRSVRPPASAAATSQEQANAERVSDALKQVERMRQIADELVTARLEHRVVDAVRLGALLELPATVASAQYERWHHRLPAVNEGESVQRMLHSTAKRARQETDTIVPGVPPVTAEESGSTTSDAEPLEATTDELVTERKQAKPTDPLRRSRQSAHRGPAEVGEASADRTDRLGQIASSRFLDGSNDPLALAGPSPDDKEVHVRLSHLIDDQPNLDHLHYLASDRPASLDRATGYYELDPAKSARVDRPLLTGGDRTNTVAISADLAADGRTRLLADFSASNDSNHRKSLDQLAQPVVERFAGQPESAILMSNDPAIDRLSEHPQPRQRTLARSAGDTRHRLTADRSGAVGERQAPEVLAAEAGFEENSSAIDPDLSVDRAVYRDHPGAGTEQYIHRPGRLERDHQPDRQHRDRPADQRLISRSVFGRGPAISAGSRRASRGSANRGDDFDARLTQDVHRGPLREGARSAKLSRREERVGDSQAAQLDWPAETPYPEEKHLIPAITGRAADRTPLGQ